MSDATPTASPPRWGIALLAVGIAVVGLVRVPGMHASFGMEADASNLLYAWPDVPWMGEREGRHPPLFLWLTHLVQWAWEATGRPLPVDVMGRILPVTAGVLTAPVVFLASRRSLGTVAAVLVGLLLATDGSLLAASWWVADHTLFVLASVLAPWTLLRVVEHPTTARENQLLAAVVFLGLSSYLGLLVLAGMALWLVVVSPKADRAWRNLVLGGVLVTPWLWRLARTIRAEAARHSGGAATALGDPEWAIEGPVAIARAMQDHLHDEWHWVFPFAAIGLVRALHARDRVLGMVITVGAVGFVGLSAMSMVTFVADRYALYLLVPIWVLVVAGAAGPVSTRPRWGLALLLALGPLVSLHATVCSHIVGAQAAPPEQASFRDVVEATEAEPEAPIVVLHPFDQPIIALYAHPDPILACHAQPRTRHDRLKYCPTPTRAVVSPKQRTLVAYPDEVLEGLAPYLPAWVVGELPDDPDSPIDADGFPTAWAGQCTVVLRGERTLGWCVPPTPQPAAEATPAP